MRTALLILISLGFAIGRVLMEPHGVSREDVFKDFAHLWVGGLFFGVAVAWYARRLIRRYVGAIEAARHPEWRVVAYKLRDLQTLTLMLAVALTVVEVIVAVGGRILKGSLVLACLIAPALAASPPVLYLPSDPPRLYLASAEPVVSVAVIGAEWCGPCLRLKDECKGMANVGFVDIDKEPETVRKLWANATSKDATGLPTSCPVFVSMVDGEIVKLWTVNEGKSVNRSVVEQLLRNPRGE